VIIKIQDPPIITLNDYEQGLCDTFGKRMFGKSIAAKRDGQNASKIAKDFALGVRAEFAFWKSVPWTSHTGPDLEVYEDRSRCSFDPDVGVFQVKTSSSYKGVTSWVFQKSHLKKNRDGYVALMFEADSKYKLLYILDYAAVDEVKSEMKLESLRKTKCAVYLDTLKGAECETATLEEIERRFKPLTPAKSMDPREAEAYDLPPHGMFIR
jgi:hypothetical protein